MNASVRVIEPASGLGGSGAGELWRARELVLFLALRDLKVRYTQAVLGWSWAVLQPVAMTAVFAFFFGHLAGVPSDGLPYAVFALCGSVPWSFFANSVSINAESLTRNSALVSKVYFPRLAVPVAAVLSYGPDLLATTAILLAVTVLSGIAPGWHLVLLPAFVALAAVSAVAVSTWTAALSVAYRDVRFVVPFVLQLWLFLTPVIYPPSLLPARWRWVLGVNPLAAVVAGFRWTVAGGPPPSPATLVVSGAVTAAVLVSGVVYFRRVEQFFADLI